MYRRFDSMIGGDITTAIDHLCIAASGIPRDEDGVEGYEMDFNGVLIRASRDDVHKPDTRKRLLAEWEAGVGRDRQEAEAKHRAWLLTPEGIEATRKEQERNAKCAAIRTSGPPTFRCRDDEAWKSWVDANNDDGYGRACILYAAYWAHLMDAAMTPEDDAAPLPWLGENADRLAHDANVEGITGFMYGCAVQMLARCWVHGDALKKWHNKEWGQPDADGIVNPAVMTVAGKD